VLLVHYDELAADLDGQDARQPRADALSWIDDQAARVSG
jgi:hypothetical protein